MARTLKTLNTKSLTLACGELAVSDPHLASVYFTYGTPPMWDREPGFATLLNIILEQQVSLASAKACFDKLASQSRRPANGTAATARHARCS